MDPELVKQMVEKYYKTNIGAFKKESYLSKIYNNKNNITGPTTIPTSQRAKNHDWLDAYTTASAPCVDRRESVEHILSEIENLSQSNREEFVVKLLMSGVPYVPDHIFKNIKGSEDTLKVLQCLQMIKQQVERIEDELGRKIIMEKLSEETDTSDE